MGRSKPDILIDRNIDCDLHQVTSAEGLFVVVYKNQIINYRILDTVSDRPPVYKKTTYVNKGQAFHLADKLNTRFSCDDFTVKFII